jgi:hypothetical protein
MSPTTQPLLVSPVGLIAMAHEPTAESLPEKVIEKFSGAVINEIKRHRRGGKNPQP